MNTLRRSVSNLFIVPLSPLVLLCAIGLGGCSQKASDASSSSSTAQCKMRFSGNTLSSVDSANCSDLSVLDDAGVADYSLEFQAQTPEIPRFDVAIDLGPTPAPGAFSSETSSNWSVSGLNGGGCAFVAGTDAARVGSFALTLVSLAGDAGIGSDLHGSLDLTAYVEMAAGMDCGISDNEALHVDF